MSDRRFLGWHWLANDRRLAYGPDRCQIRKGSVRHYAGQPVLCSAGLHWSTRCLDALYDVPGSIVCRVEAWGETVHGGGKSASQHRKVLWMFDAERVLWAYICDLAEDALLLTEVTDPRAWAAIELRRKWLDGGRVTDSQWLAACDAAWDAGDVAWDVAGKAAWDATGAAAWAVDGDAAWDAAWYAAEAAAWAAGEAAMVIARAAQNDRLEALLFAEARKHGLID